METKHTAGPWGASPEKWAGFRDGELAITATGADEIFAKVEGGE